MTAAPAKRGLIETAVVKLYTREAVVREVQALGEHFRLIRLGGEALRGRSWVPGEIVQIALSGWKHRSYTPLAWNAEDGTLEFVTYLHGDGVAARWAGSLAGGERCHVFPRDALKLAALRRPSVLVGDETSFGTSAALRATGPGLRDVTLIFEVASASEARAVLAKIGVHEAVLVERQPEDRHLDALEREVLDLFHVNSTTHGIFTGQASTIQRLYRAVRRSQVPARQLKTYAYWAPGKQGLD